MNKLLTTISILGSLVFAGTASAEGTFQIGPQFGYSKTDVSSPIYGESNDFDMNGGAVGLIARYNLPVGKDGAFVGIQAGVAKEFASQKDSFSGTLTDNVNTVSGSIAGKSSVEWSADIMPRVGYNFGKLSVSMAAGVSFIQGSQKVSVSGTLTGPAFGLLSGSGSFKDTQWHTGWKVAPGIDYELTDNISLFSQVHYARYNSKTYSDSGLTSKAKPKMYGARVGILYSF